MDCFLEWACLFLLLSIFRDYGKKYGEVYSGLDEVAKEEDTLKVY